MKGKFIKDLLVVFTIPYLISCQKKDTDTPRQINTHAAIDIINRYTQAFAEGDSTGILPFWSSRSVENVDFWNLHAYIGTRLWFSSWIDFLQVYKP